MRGSALPTHKTHELYYLIYILYMCCCLFVDQTRSWVGVRMGGRDGAAVGGGSCFFPGSSVLTNNNNDNKMMSAPMDELVPSVHNTSKSIFYHSFKPSG